MREHHHHLQTPLKELGNRRSKSLSDQSKKPLKQSSKRNLNAVFESQSAATFTESSPEESVASSSLISDYSNLLTESSAAAADFPLIPETSPSSEAVDPLLDSTPISSTVTSDKYKEFTGSSGILESSDAKTGSTEAEIAVKYLKEAQMQVMNATDVDIRYKKVLDAVINTVVEEFYGLPEDEDWCDKLISKKFHLVSLTFLLWIIAAFIGLFFRLGQRHSLYRSLPT